ncbi:MAG: hypothetical protein KKC26_07900 [Nanoarchaeota archaeon]|nr:hypothetical protein [Nanoarchaeota archaeon]
MRDHLKKYLLMAIVTLFVIIVINNVLGDPVGTSVTSNSSSGRSDTPVNRADEGGQIVTMLLSATQQNYAWKAYVGNISGGLTLDDANEWTIYDWTLSSYTGEIFASRAGSGIAWGSINCSNASRMATENTALNMGSTDIDNINNTFGETSHANFVVAGRTMTGCPSEAMYVNDSSQVMGANALFQEIILHDGTNTVFTSVLEENLVGYDNSSQFDFQMIVPEDDTGGVTTTYYFYAELDS